MKPVTLCLLLKENEVLLAMKKRGFGVGKWNGVGGKVEEGESIEEAAVREIKEEIGVSTKLDSLEKVGNVKFYFKDNPEWNQQMHIFLVKEWEGEPQESEEMRPQWFSRKSVPIKKMWSSDVKWLPIILNGKKIKGEFYYKDTGESFSKFDIREV